MLPFATDPVVPARCACTAWGEARLRELSGPPAKAVQWQKARRGAGDFSQAVVPLDCDGLNLSGLPAPNPEEIPK